MTIYIDVLVILNLYINYFLLRGTSLLIKHDISVKRCLLSACAGALFSLVILLPELPFIITVITKVCSGITLVFIGFRTTKGADFIIAVITFLLVSFVYAGAMLGLWLFIAPHGMYYRNGMTYFNIPIIAVAAISAVSYGIIRFVRFISDRRCTEIRYETISITSGEYSVTVKGFADTGNSLRDPFSGLPVILCQMNDIAPLVPQYIHNYFTHCTDDLDGLRLIPCHTICGRSLIPVFRADSITIAGRKVAAMIGVYVDDTPNACCIFNPEIISI